MAESKKGHNFAIQGPTAKKKKKVLAHLFLVLMLLIKFQVPSSSGSLVLQPTKGITDRQKDRQTDGIRSKVNPHLVNISRNSLKSKSGHLNIEPNQHAKY